MKQHIILLVEDSDSDVELIRQFLSRGPGAPQLVVATDGEEALHILRRETPHDQDPRPDLIVLDLNLPRKNGKELLADLKQDPKLKLIPVVVLSTSDAEPDVVNAYQLHANCYVTKPADLNDFERTVRWIEDFWFSVVQLPAD